MAQQTAGEAAQELSKLLGATSTDPRVMLAAAKKKQADFIAAVDSANAWKAKAVRVEAAFSAAGQHGTAGSVDGVRIFSKEEAQEFISFGSFRHSPTAARRAEATELSTGKSLAEALKSGLLR